MNRKELFCVLFSAVLFHCIFESANVGPKCYVYPKGRLIMPEREITESYLQALERYFAGEVNAREAAKEAGLGGPNRFLESV